MNIRTAAAGLAVLALAGCTAKVAGQASYVAPVTRTVTATPKPPPAPKPAPTHTVTIAPSQPPAPPTQSDPWAVVSEYYGDVTSHDYQDAWNLLGPQFQASLGSYDQFVAGYAGTGAQLVSETGESGDDVTYSLESDNPDGSVQLYDGAAFVSDGKIQSAHVTQIYGSRGA